MFENAACNCGSPIVEPAACSWMRTELFSPSAIRYGITAIAFFTSSEKK